MRESAKSHPEEASALLTVLTWNLFHGRAVPPAGRPLREEFGWALASWEWDVALLQEVPPWWAPDLAQACGATHHTARTARNWLLPVRRVIADRWPDLIKSSGGGANVILVRGEAAEHRVRRLRRRPERRIVHAVRLANGTLVGNLHAQVDSEERARRDADRAGESVLAWAGGARAILGGDFNLPTPEVAGFAWMGGHHVDHVLARGFESDGPGTRPARGALSDHEPVLVELSELESEGGGERGEAGDSDSSS